MKLFIWEDVLEDYSCGMICVLAETEEQAFELLYEKDSIAWSQMQGLWHTHSWENEELKELESKYPNDDLGELQMRWMKKQHLKLMPDRTKPKVIIKPEAFVVHGGG